MPHHTPRHGSCWSALRRAGTGIVAIALFVAVAPATARAGEAEPPPQPTIIKTTDPVIDPDPPPVDEPPGLVPPLSPGLEDLPVTSPEFNAARHKLQRASGELSHIRQIAQNAARELLSLARQDEALTTEVARVRRRVDALARHARRTRAHLRNLAVASYVSGTDMSTYQAFLQLDADLHNELRSQAVMVDKVNTDMTADLRRTLTALRAARHDLRVTTETRDDVRDRISEVRRIQAQAGAEEQNASARVFVAIGLVEKWRRVAIVRGTDIPLVVLDGYVRAARISALLNPDCGIPWWALAGIGRTESHHASAGGAEVRADGSLTKPILGIPLDGSGDTASIRLAGGIADRAQGPMQFITSTWLKWGLDGNNDGVADVQNTYDAAAAAADYLCAGGPMKTDDDFRRGYFSYNHSQAYVEVVLTRAHEYEQEVEMPTAE
jgi:membrane-bound lytic murein transglycosylase B